MRKMLFSKRENRSFRVKVLLSIAVLSTVATLTVSFFFLQSSTRALEENYTQTLWSRLLTADQTMDKYLQDAYGISLALCHDPELERLTAAYEALPLKDTEALLESRQGISAYLKSFCRDTSAVESIYLYLPERKQVITSDIYHSVQEIFVPRDHQWITRPASHGSLSPGFVEDTVRSLPQPTLSYVRTVEGPDGGLGMTVAVNLDERKLFYRCIDQVQLTGQEYFYLTTPEGMVVSATAMADLGRPIAQALPEAAALGGSHRLQAYAVKDGPLLASVTSVMTGYRLIASRDRGELTATVAQQQRYVLLLAVVVAAVLLISAFFLSEQVYQPVKELKAAMEAVSGGDLSVRAQVLSNDEIGQLTEGFNDMVAQIEGLIGELVTERMQKKEAELEALQYQITPHFMYNTLNSIKYAAHLQGVPALGEQLGAFIELLQASISKNGAFVLLKDEIRLVENYVKLQNFRYMDRFAVSYAVDAAAEGCYVPRLLLQPLVENAILHGQNQRESLCAIQITVRRREESLFLSVRDQGPGMTREQIDRLLSDEGPKSGFNGIGVRNIQERLRLYYGEKACLRYVSGGKGTKAMIVLPASRDPGEYQI